MEALKRTAEEFQKRGIHARVFENAEEVKRALLEAVEPHATVAFGGSVTLQELGA